MKLEDFLRIREDVYTKYKDKVGYYKLHVFNLKLTKFLKKTDGLEPPWGHTRNVFTIEDRPEVVFKLAKDEEGIDANLQEILNYRWAKELGVDWIFPQTDLLDKDLQTLVVEKCHIFKSKEEMEPYLNQYDEIEDIILNHSYFALVFSKPVKMAYLDLDKSDRWFNYGLNEKGLLKIVDSGSISPYDKVYHDKKTLFISMRNEHIYSPPILKLHIECLHFLPDFPTKDFRMYRANLLRRAKSVDLEVSEEDIKQMFYIYREYFTD